MGDIIQFKPRPAMPEEAHRCMRLAVKCLDKMQQLHVRIYAIFSALGYDVTKPAPPKHIVPPEAKRLCLRAGEYKDTATRLMLKAEAIAIDAKIPRKYWMTPGVWHKPYTLPSPKGAA